MLFTKVIVLAKYLSFTDIYLKQLIVEFLEYSYINKYIINLEEDKQLFYKPIYSFKPIKLEIFKTYINSNRANNFINLCQSLTKAPILFIKISESSLYLCVNY